MEHSAHFPALVIRHRNYEEADQFVTFLTAFHGRVSALAKGVRKLNSKKAGHLQSFNFVDVQIGKGRGSSWLVTQVTTLESYTNITMSLEKTARAACVLELADKFSLEEVENPDLFQLTLDTMRRMNYFEDVFPVQRYFDLRLFDVAGYRPQLRTCVKCRKPIQAEAQFISFEMGGVLCPECGRMFRDARPISMKSLKYLRYYQQQSFQEAAAAGWPQDIRFESERILTAYQTYLLEYKTNSQTFLEKI